MTSEIHKSGLPAKKTEHEQTTVACGLTGAVDADGGEPTAERDHAIGVEAVHQHAAEHGADTAALWTNQSRCIGGAILLMPLQCSEIFPSRTRKASNTKNG